MAYLSEQSSVFSINLCASNSVADGLSGECRMKHLLFGNVTITKCKLSLNLLLYFLIKNRAGSRGGVCGGGGCQTHKGFHNAARGVKEQSSGGGPGA